MARSIARGNKVVILLTSAPSNLAAPTQAELTAGTDISADVAAINGFEQQTSIIDEESLATRTNTQTPGVISFGDNSLEFYDQGATTTVKDLFTQDDAVWLAFLVAGQAESSPSEIWPVTVAAPPRTMHGQDINQQQKFRVPFAVTAAPTDGTQAA